MKRSGILLIIIVVLIAFSGVVSAITKKDAENSLKLLAPDVKVLSVKESAIKGLWEVVLESRGKKGIAYIDDTGKKVIIGSIYDLDTRRNLTKERFEEINRVDFSSIPLDDAIILGSKKAEKKIVVFDDPDCPFCAKVHPELKALVEERKDVAIYIKMFPLRSIHPKAYDKARAIMCQKSNEERLKLLEDSFAKKELPKPECDNKVVDKQIELGTRLGITGTPTFVFQSGIKKSGYMKKEIIEKFIEKK